MSQFGRKNILRTMVFSKVTFVVLLLIVLFFSHSVFERYTVERDMAKRRDDTQAQYDALLERKQSLLEKVDYLEGESGREAEIRKHFDVAREGEKVVIIVDDEKVTDTQQERSTSSPAENERPWYKFW